MKVWTMINLYRKLTKNEFIVVGGDCSQGGIDANYVQFLSKDRIDVPMKLKMQGVAASMTPVLHQTLEWIYDTTGIQPVVALERNMGGASEMERLRKLNRQNKYRLYIAKKEGTTKGMQDTEKIGWDTTGGVNSTGTRPRMIGDLKEAVDSMQLTIYDKDTVDQLTTFIVNKNNRPEAASGTHDDAVMSLAIAWQLYQTENKIIEDDDDDDYYSGNVTGLWNN